MLSSMSKNVVLMLILFGLTCAMEGDRKINELESNLKNSLLMEEDSEPSIEGSNELEKDQEKSLVENNQESNAFYVPVLESEKNVDLRDENKEPISCIICYNIEKTSENPFLFTRNCEMGHGPFCKECLRKLFENEDQADCPICRKEVNALEYTFIRDEMEERGFRIRGCRRIRRILALLVNFCSCRGMIFSVLIFLIVYLWYSLIRWKMQTPNSPSLYNGEGYLACPHPVSIVPADVTFWKENGEVCLTASAAATKMCYDAISNLIEKCAGTSTSSSGEGTYSDSCTKEVLKEIKKTNDAMIAQIANFTSTPTAEYPSGYKLTNGADDRGFKVQFSDTVAQSGCVDRCNVPTMTCGTLTDIKVHHNYVMKEWDDAHYLTKNTWTITFPHLMEYSLKTNQSLADPKIVIKWSDGNFFGDGFWQDIYSVNSNGATGTITATYFSGKRWYRDCKKSGKTNWENRCNPESFWTLEELVDFEVPMQVEGVLGGMKWVAHSTFENWDSVKNGVTETSPSGKLNNRILVLKNESTGTDDHLIKIVNKNSVDPMAFATLYMARYYNASIKQGYIDAQNKICDSGKCYTKLRKD